MSRVLSELRYQRGSRKHRLVLTGDLEIDHGFGNLGHHELYDGDTCEAVINRNRLIIFTPFGCDGCSPSRRIPFTNFYVGTWTPHSAVAGCFAHDLVRKYLGLPCLAAAGVTRKLSDDLFWNLLDNQGFRGRDLYHGVVAGDLGNAYMRLTRGLSAIRCACCPPDAPLLHETRELLPADPGDPRRNPDPLDLPATPLIL